MITREEFGIMQQQMVSMNDEKLDMMAQIATLRASNEQIAIIQNQVFQERESRAKEEKKMTKEREKLQAKVSALNNEMRGEGKKTWDEKKVQKLEIELKEKVSESVNQDETIEALKSRISTLQQEEARVDSKLDEIESRVRKVVTIQKRIGSLQPLTLHISELESRCASRLNRKKKLEGRIQNRTLAAEKLESAKKVLETKLATLTQELNGILTSRAEIEGKDEATDRLLQDEQRQLEALENDLHECQTHLDHEQKTSEDQLSKVRTEVSDVEATLTAISEKVQALTKGIEQHKIDREILINKKASLIEQLNKSIKEKVNDIIRARNNSPHVLRLIESQEKHWMERQRLYEIYNAVKSRHQELTDAGTRKALVLDEMRSWIKTVPPLGTNDPMAELKHAFQAAQAENKKLATELAQLQQELSNLQRE